MVIDGHSHVGKDFYNSDISLNDYMSFCRKANIDKGIVMPMPWPCYNKGKETYSSLMWEHNNYIERYYYKVRVSDGNKQAIIKNPYEVVNNQIYNEIVSQDSNIDIYFAPLLHGKLDNPDYLTNLLNNKKVVAIKIHGFASGFSIEDIKPEVIEVLKKIDLPLIIHTSVYNYGYGYGKDTKYWINLDHPIRWAKFLLDYKLTGVLNHGVALNEETIELVNKNDNLMIGIGPDLDLNNDYFKLDIPQSKAKKVEYLKELKKKVSADKMIFDIDYNWNVDSNNVIDLEAVNRVLETWNYGDADKILSQNAERIFTKIKSNSKIRVK